MFLSLFFPSPPLSLSSCYVQNISSFHCPLQSDGTAMWIQGPAFTAGYPAFVSRYEETGPVPWSPKFLQSLMINIRQKSKYRVGWALQSIMPTWEARGPRTYHTCKTMGGFAKSVVARIVIFSHWYFKNITLPCFSSVLFFIYKSNLIITHCHYYHFNVYRLYTLLLSYTIAHIMVSLLAHN